MSVMTVDASAALIGQFEFKFTSESNCSTSGTIVRHATRRERIVSFCYEVQ